ncbi:MAG: FAD-dependent oxidoreductase [Acidobacteriia bacterium]|nr:FAD-dependent oxidoreductase [Terriglobia bacterium]
MKLFEPISFAGLRVKNRVVMPPMGMGYCHPDGSVSDRVVNYYKQRAAGGVGMIVVENCIVDPDVLGVGPELNLFDDKFIPGLARVVDAVKPFGSTIGLQLNHMGRQTTLGKPVAPSPIGISERGPVPRVLDQDGIRYVVDEFVSAAHRGQKAGFEFIEIHGAHGYLICEFISPLSNRRDDDYGGDPDRRLRFSREIVQGIRQLCGERFPIQFRISGSEYVPGGLTLDDTAYVSKKLVEFGVASVSVSAGNWQTLKYIMAPMFMPAGLLADDAARIKSAVSVPVIAVGRIHSAALAEKILLDGKADMVAVGRGLIADPDWAKKAEEGHAADVRPCISCNTCVDYVSRAMEVKCTVNAGLGREYDFEIEPAPRPARVVIAGGGPGGLEAARVARLRGHHVTLVERDTRLGGKLHLSAAAPSKKEVNSFTDFLSRQVHNLGVDVRMGEQLNRDTLLALQPELVVLATGSVPVVPPIPGAQLPHVAVAEDVLLERVQVGKRVVIVGGGGTGCETAEWLMERGHQVAIIEMMSHIGLNIEAISRRWMYYEFKKFGVKLLTQCRVLRIESSQVIYANEQKQEFAEACDSVVIALGYRPNDSMSFCEDEGFPVPVYRVGDCEKPGTILDAVTMGANLAARI